MWFGWDFGEAERSFRKEAEWHSRMIPKYLRRGSDAGNLILWRVFSSAKKKPVPERSGGWMLLTRKGCEKRRHVLSSASAHSVWDTSSASGLRRIQKLSATIGSWNIGAIILDPIP